MNKNYCRICGLKRCEDNLIYFVSLFQNDGVNAELTKHAAMFVDCLFSLNPSDGCPRYLCGGCKIKLSQFHEFREKALNTHIFFMGKRDASKCSVNPGNQTAVEYNDNVEEEFIPIKCDVKKEDVDSNGSLNDWYANFDDASLSSIKSEDAKQPAMSLRSKQFKTTGEIKINEEKPDNEKIFVCKHCPMEFTTFPDLSDHELSHSNQKKWACNQCDATFKLKDYLYQHVYRLHSGKSECTCDICGNTYRYKASLIRHIRVTHRYKVKCDYHKSSFPYIVKADRAKRKPNTKRVNKPIPHICRFCGKGFPGPSHLVVHESRHTDLRLLSCKYCGMKFKVEIDLKQHIRRHENKTKFICDICGKSYSQKIILSRHISTIHANLDEIHECQYCFQRLKTKNSLTSHVFRTHVNAGKYLCLVCDTAFGWSTDLKRHVNGHVKKGLIKDYEVDKYMKIDIKRRNV